jgi:hypothetical protein
MAMLPAGMHALSGGGGYDEDDNFGEDWSRIVQHAVVARLPLDVLERRVFGYRCTKERGVVTSPVTSSCVCVGGGKRASWFVHVRVRICVPPPPHVYIGLSRFAHVLCASSHSVDNTYRFSAVSKFTTQRAVAGLVRFAADGNTCVVNASVYSSTKRCLLCPSTRRCRLLRVWSCFGEPFPTGVVALHCTSVSRRAPMHAVADAGITMRSRWTRTVKLRCTT